MLTSFAVSNESSCHSPDEDIAGAQAWAGSLPMFRLRDVRDTIDVQHDRRDVEPRLPAVGISPKSAVKRRAMSWRGMTAEFIETTGTDRTEFRFRAPVHLLVIYVHGARRQGETSVEGLNHSTLRDFTQKLTFVPAGHEYREWLEPRGAASLMFFYFDPAVPGHELPESIGETTFAPRLFFEDRTLWDTAIKLRRLIQEPTAEDPRYLEAVGAVLVHELVRLSRGAGRAEPLARGGLAAWQIRTVTAYIEEHLAEPIPLATLAKLVHLSPYHFCRTFKQSFGMPPHRYHTSRRIERAKAMLKKPAFSVTDIGLTVGFSETSSFTAAFRKATGLTPTAYHRSLA